MAELFADGTRQISLSKEQFDAINTILAAFYKQTKCKVIMLSDASGLAVALKGTKRDENMSLLSSLAAGNYAATGEIAKIIKEEDSFSGQFHEGKSQSIYLKGVDDDFFLTIVFGKNTTFGMIRVLVDRIIPELADILATFDKKPEAQQGSEKGSIRDDMSENEFRDELSSRLDAVLGKF